MSAGDGRVLRLGTTALVLSALSALLLGIALGWVGWGPVLVGVYAGFLLGGVLGGLLSVLRIVERKGFPFGPFMLLGALVGLLWGEPLWSALVSG